MAAPIQDNALADIASAPRLSYWRLVVSIGGLALVWWLLEYIYQYYQAVPGELGVRLVRSFGFSGATFISLALLSSTVFKWFPRTAVHWRVRRYLGVAGFVFIFLHVMAAWRFYFNYDLRAIYFSWNPLENPIVFGTMAFPILFVMAATSTDWAMRKLKRWWKFIHRFVYLAYLASIFHFVLINPTIVLHTLPGRFLLVVAAVTVAAQLYWYIRISLRRHFRSVGAIVGLMIIIAGVATGYFVYRRLFG